MSEPRLNIPQKGEDPTRSDWQAGPSGRFMVKPKEVGILEANPDKDRPEMVRILFEDPENKRDVMYLVPYDDPTWAYDRLHPILPVLTLEQIAVALQGGTKATQMLVADAFSKIPPKNYIAECGGDMVYRWMAGPGEQLGHFHSVSPGPCEVYDPTLDQMIEMTMPTWKLSQAQNQRVWIYLVTADGPDGAGGGLFSNFNVSYNLGKLALGTEMQVQPDGTSIEVDCPAKDLFEVTAPQPFLYRLLRAMGLRTAEGEEDSLHHYLVESFHKYGGFYARVRADGTYQNGFFHNVNNVLPELVALLYRHLAESMTFVQWEVVPWDPNENAKYRLGLIRDGDMPTVTKVAAALAGSLRTGPTWPSFLASRVKQYPPALQREWGGIDVTAPTSGQTDAWRDIRESFRGAVDQLATLVNGTKTVAVFPEGAKDAGSLSMEGERTAKGVLLPILEAYRPIFLVDPDDRRPENPLLPLRPERWRREPVEIYLMAIMSLAANFEPEQLLFGQGIVQEIDHNALLEWFKENYEALLVEHKPESGANAAAASSVM